MTLNQRHNNVASTSFLYDVFTWPASVVKGTHATYDAQLGFISVTNTDGTLTFYFGSFVYSEFAESLTGGSVTRVVHQAAGGFVLETWDNLTAPIPVSVFPGASGSAVIAALMSGADTVVGSIFDDKLRGGDGGAVFFLGQGGRDEVWLGDAGFPVPVRYGLDYSAYGGVDGHGINMNLSNGFVERPGVAGPGDRIENSWNNNVDVTLTNFDDILNHNPNKGTINALAGNDVISGQGGGDTIDGGTGIYTVDYSWFPGGPFAVPEGTGRMVGPLFVNLAANGYTGIIGEADYDFIVLDVFFTETRFDSGDTLFNMALFRHQVEPL